MEIREISAREYGAIFPGGHVFNTVAFSEYNRPKCDDGDVRYLVAEDSRVRGGLILGRRGGELRNPFSAPFGGVESEHELRFNILEEVWRAVWRYAETRGMGLRVVLPPELHSPGQTMKSVNILKRLGFESFVDVNYHFALTEQDITAGASRSCRKLMRQAYGKGLEIERLDKTPENIARVYGIIEENHRAKGYHMAMSAEDVEGTLWVVNGDIFVVRHGADEVAGALIYDVAPGVAQIINWGDRPGFGDLRPMNYFISELYAHYRERGYRVLDFGPAVENGIPNYGLCDFKEGLGAQPTLKFTFWRG